MFTFTGRQNTELHTLNSSVHCLPALLGRCVNRTCSLKMLLMWPHHVSRHIGNLPALTNAPLWKWHKKSENHSWNSWCSLETESHHQPVAGADVGTCACRFQIKCSGFATAHNFFFFPLQILHQLCSHQAGHDYYFLISLEPPELVLTFVFSQAVYFKYS